MNPRIVIVGGIFDKPAEYRAAHRISPETTLADGLSQEGWDVRVQGHASPLRLEDVDLVHVHHFGRAACRMLGQASSCRFVFTSHDAFLLHDMPRGWKRRIIDPLILRGADGLVALSRREREFFLARYRVCESRTEVIPNGISNIFSKGSQRTDNDKDLLFVGQLQAFKGLDWLFEAIPQVRVRHPDVRLRICYQTDALAEHYRRLASRLGIERSILFVGPRTPEQLAELYRSCAIFVHPSLAECLSTVVSEAMLAGACIVATEVGGIAEQIDEESGVIVPPRDSRALATVICRLLDDPRQRRRLATAARGRAIERFAVPLMIERHIQFYERVLAMQPNRQSTANPWLAEGLRTCTRYL